MFVDRCLHAYALLIGYQCKQSPMAPSPVSVWHLVSLLFFFRVRCCSAPVGSPWCTNSSQNSHTHTHLYVDRSTHTHLLHPQSLIYSYLMLWCHNSLSGSLAWQPFAPEVGKGTSLFPRRWDGICLQQTHTPHKDTHTHHCSSPRGILPPRCAARRLTRRRVAPSLGPR